MQTMDLPTSKMIGGVEGGIGWVIFNHPERRNAVCLEMWQAIPLIMDRLEADPAVRVIVLRGVGGQAFVSGADISEFEKVRSTPQQVAEYEKISGEAQRRLKQTTKPTIAMIEGFCIGGGMGIAIGTDLRIASTGARFGIPAARLGLGYGADGITVLIDLIGPSFAKEIFFTARQFTADEAARMGLVNRVVPEGELDGAVRAMAGMIADNAPLTVKSVKICVGEIVKGPDMDHDLCEQVVDACFASADYVEGRRAFMEKRRPVFQGG